MLPILSTKLNVPSLHGEIVHRRRLIERLFTNLNRKLTLISAPPGFGKTTLVIEWLSQKTFSATWYSLDQRDNDPIQFFIYLISALQHCYPGLGDGLLHSLQSPRPPGVEEIITHLINAIAAKDSPFLLVLDDFHVIENTQLLTTIGRLVEHQPDQLHLVITSREDPPFPLARLRARGELLEIRAKDLQFTQEEATDYFSRVMKISLTGSQVEALEERTEGWVAGLQLAAISIQGEYDPAMFIQAFSGSHRIIVDYLTDEILKNLPEDICQFLLKTSILDRFNASLCDAVTGRNDSQMVLQRIEEMNLFLVQLDTERQWYRYHHLFSDVLRKQLNQSRAEKIARLTLQASRWHEAQGLIVDAVQYAQAAKDQDHLVKLIEKYSIEVIMRGHIYLARSWIEALPRELRERHSRINMNYAWALFLSGEFEPLPMVLNQVEANTSAVDVLGEASAMHAFLAIHNPGQMQEYALHALEIVSDDNLMVRGLVHMGLANVHAQLGEKAQAFEQFAQAIPLHWAAGNKVAATNAILDLVLQNLALGRWNRTYHIITDLLDLSQDCAVLDDPAIGLAYIGLGWCLLRQGRISEAIVRLEQGLALAESGGYKAANVAYLPLMQAKIIQSSPAEIRELLPEFTERLDQLPDAYTSVLGVWFADIYLLFEEISKAEQWLGKSNPEEEYYFKITLARMEIQKARNGSDKTRYPHILSLLTELMQQLEKQSWNGYQIEACILKALTYDAMGNTVASFADLKHAIILSEPENDMYSFIREGAALQSLLKRLPDIAYAQTLLEAFPRKRGETRREFTHPDLVEPLSEREMEVLHRMMQGASYGDIADQLIISINTVRYHVKSLYQKLGVSSRSEAIARAQELRIS